MQLISTRLNPKSKQSSHLKPNWCIYLRRCRRLWLGEGSYWTGGNVVATMSYIDAFHLILVSVFYFGLVRIRLLVLLPCGLTLNNCECFEARTQLHGGPREWTKKCLVEVSESETRFGAVV